VTAYVFLAEAEAEYLDAIRFYESQQAGIGSALIRDFERTIGFAVDKPQSWKQIHPLGIHWIDLAKFPYAIIYGDLPDAKIQIMAFAHHRRQPEYWQHRFS
jgi:hypothetical protein